MILAFNDTLFNGIVSYYKLDGNSIDLVSSNNATDTSITYVSGKINQGAYFDGSFSRMNNIGDLNTFSFIQNTGIFSFNLWLKVDDLVNEGGILTSVATFNPGFYFEKYGTGIYVLMCNILGSQSFGFTSVLTDLNWHMLSLVGNGASISLYYDSTLISNQSYTLTLPATGDSQNKLAIGGFPDTSQYKLSGLIDEVGIWNRALTQVEINRLYNSSSGLQYQYPKILSYNNRLLNQTSTLIREGLQIYVNAGDTKSYPATGTTWYDLTNNHRDGNLVNSPAFSGDCFNFYPPSDQYVELSNTSLLAGEEFTVSLVVKFFSASTLYYVMAKGYDGGYGTYWFNKGIFAVGTSDSYFQVTTTPADNTWYYYTGTYKNNVASFYVNGTLIGTTPTTGTIRTNPHNIVLGKYAIEYAGFGEYSDIAEFTYHSLCLSQSQIQNNFNSLRNKYNI